MIETARLKLQIPEVSTDNMSDGDNVLSANYDLIDLNAHCRVVTNLVDVINPFNGQHVHVLSTGINYIRKNNVWALFAEPVSGGGSGSKGTNQITARATISPGSEVKITQVTFTPVAGTRYLIRGSVNVGLDSTSFSYTLAAIKLRWATGTNVTTAGTLLSSSELTLVTEDFTSNGTAADFGTIVLDEIYPNNTTELSVGLFIAADSAGGAAYASPNGMGSGAGFVTYCNLSIYDWGA